MRPYYVYILECTDKSFYVGFTNDVKRRLAEHQTE
ncbi:GIY-YIG nuclease family protein [Zobellia roscoffensis]|nr:GIY-YIG nuclease family protein [Zobellia roscoffensis]